MTDQSDPAVPPAAEPTVIEIDAERAEVVAALSTLLAAIKARREAIRPKSPVTFIPTPYVWREAPTTRAECAERRLMGLETALEQAVRRILARSHTIDQAVRRGREPDRRRIGDCGPSLGRGAAIDGVWTA